jgi:serine/threonine protein kinase
MANRAKSQPAQSAANHVAGQTLANQYRLLSEIGRGGMGLVYEAERPNGTRVAVKMLSKELLGSEAALTRFRREAQIISTLEHANIVRYLDIGETPDGQPYVVLELLTGRPLDAELDKIGPLAIGRAVRIAVQIAAALETAHAAGVIHRDLKPENIFLDANDKVKVLDFGVSKFLGPLMGHGTRTGELLGTPNYMAPEQVHDARSASEATDVYGLGAVIYQMLTCRPPYLNASISVMLLQIMVEAPPPIATQRPDLPPELVQTLERAMSRNAGDRFQKMPEFARALEPFSTLDDPPRFVPLAEEKSRRTVTPPSIVATPPPTMRVARRNTPWMIASVLLIVLGGVGLYWKRRSVEAAAAEPVTASRIDLDVTADAPRASMRVYGQVYPLPFHGPVERSAAPVSVEITAPGHEGRIYAVPMREAETLRVTLPAGDGVKNATEEETTRALVER